MPRCRFLLVAALAVLAPAGCASADRRGSAAADTVGALLTALRDGDGAAACAVLAPDTRAALERSADRPCAEAVLDEDLPGPSEVLRTDVYGQWAQVRSRSDTVFLAMFPGGWRVVAAGCTPRGERPYACRLDGG